MNKFKQILVACFCVFLSTVSCDKEIISDSATPSVIQARANAAARLRTDIDKVFLNYDFAKHKIVPLWDLAVVFKNKKSIEVPYTVDGKLMIPMVSKTLQGRQRLLLTYNGSKVSAMIMQYFPDETFRGKIKEINAENFKSKKFSGKIIFQNLGEEKLYIWILKDGKIEKKKTGRILTNGKSFRPSGWEKVCTLEPYDISMYGEINGEWVFIGTIEAYHEVCDDIYVEDGDDDDDDGNDDDPNDCNLHPEMPWCDNGGGGGGGEDFGSATSEWGSDYTYSVKDQCGGLSGMWLRQFAESKEIAGLLTNTGQIIIVPSIGNNYDNFTISSFYNNENGNRIMNFYNDGGTWKVELYSSSGVVGNYEVTGIVHTHPYPIGAGVTNNFPSGPDLGIAQSYPQLNHYILTTTGKIHYNQNGTISNDGRSCY